MPKMTPAQPAPRLFFPPGIRMTPALKANLGLLLTVLVWGTPIPLFAVLLQRWDPLTLAASRYIFALPVLIALLWLGNPALRRERRIMPRGVSWTRLLLLGGPGMCGFALLFLFGLEHSDPVSVAVIAAASPLVASIVARLVKGLRLARGVGVAIALAIAGGLLTRLDFADLGEGFSFQGGEPLVLLAVTCWSWYSVKAQDWIPGVSQLHLTTATVFAASLTMTLLVLLLALTGYPLRIPADPRPDEIALIGWIGISMVCIGILTWNLGVKYLGVVVASLFLNLIPVVAITTATILGADLRLEQVLGGLLVIAGVVQAQLRARRLPHGPLPAAAAPPGPPLGPAPGGSGS